MASTKKNTTHGFAIDVVLSFDTRFGKSHAKVEAARGFFRKLRYSFYCATPQRGNHGPVLKLKSRVKLYLGTSSYAVAMDQIAEL